MDARTALERRKRRELRAALRRGARILWFPALGLALAVPALVIAMPSLREGGTSADILFLAFGVVVLGSMLVDWLTWPVRVRPRIAPYFERALGPYGGPTGIALRRGHGLWRELETLERRARAAGVEPLSGFGFQDDLAGEAVRCHSASEGLRTVEALLAGLDGSEHRDLAPDLHALASLLRMAAGQQVGFSLLLRLGDDHGQGAIRESERRSGRLW